MTSSPPVREEQRCMAWTPGQVNGAFVRELYRCGEPIARVDGRWEHVVCAACGAPTLYHPPAGVEVITLPHPAQGEGAP